MSEQGHTRKLTAILAADVAGYSRLMAEDDAATLAALNESRDIFRARITAHQGRVIDMAGDSVLAEFASAKKAVECAVEVQRELTKRNAPIAETRRMQFRIGVNVGDILQQADGTLYGDGVNIAARLESIGEPGGVTISGTVFDQVKGRIPVAFQYIGEQTVKNIPDPVRAYRLATTSDASPPLISRRRGRLLVGAIFAAVTIIVVAGLTMYRSSSPFVAEKGGVPVVAVLALENLSGDPSQAYFSDGLTENIIDLLAQVRDLYVIARNSTFRYKGQAVDARTVGRELGATYMVEGSVRRSDKTLRVTAQLVDTQNGHHVWSKTFDRPLTPGDLLALEDEIAGSVANTLVGSFGVLRQQGLEAARRKPPNQLSTYECVLLGMEFERALSLSTFRTARDCLVKAVEVDRDQPQVWAYLSFVYRSEYIYGYDPAPGSLERALDAARQAVQLAPNDAYCRSSLALTHFSRGDASAFKTEAERAVALSAQGSTALGLLGLYMSYAGEWDKGLALIERARRLDPFHPAWYWHPKFHDFYRLRDYAGALEIGKKADLPDSALAQSLLIAAYGQLEQSREALIHLERMRRLDPQYESKVRTMWGQRFRFQPDYLEHFLEGLRKGGVRVPEQGLPDRQ